VESGVQNEGGVSDFGTMMRFYSGGGGLLRAFIVPASVVNGVIGQARLRAIMVAAERAKKKATASQPTKQPATGAGKSGGGKNP
jgi:hypothetical protein